MPPTPPRKRLSDALDDLRRAREDVERLLGEIEAETGGDPFEASQNLRRRFLNVIELDRLKRQEQKARENAEPTNADRFAEAMEQAFARSQRSTADVETD